MSQPIFQGADKSRQVPARVCLRKEPNRKKNSPIESLKSARVF